MKGDPANNVALFLMFACLFFSSLFLPLYLSAMHHGDTIITVFSASNYCGTVNNEGAFIILERDLVPRIVPFYAKPKERLSRYRMRHALLENDIISKLLQRIADNRLALTNYYNKVASVTAAGVRTVSRAIWAEGLKVTLQLNIPFAEFQDYLGLPKLGVDGKKKGDIDFQAFLLRFRPVNAMLNPLTPPVASPAASNSGSPAPSSRRSSSRTVNQNVECILEMLAKHKYELESLFRHFGQLKQLAHQHTTARPLQPNDHASRLMVVRPHICLIELVRFPVFRPERRRVHLAERIQRRGHVVANTAGLRIHDRGS
jgi:hypothetical protein